jgi:hypothetical protein
MELVAIASSHQRLTTNQRVMSRFDAVKVAVVSPLENCRRLPQSAPHTYPEHPHGEAEQTRRKEAKRPTCWGCRTTNESKDFAPGRGSYAKPSGTAICVGAAPRGEWRPFHDIRAVRKPQEQKLRPGAGLLRRTTEHRNLCRSRAPRRMAAIPRQLRRKKAARAKASPRGGAPTPSHRVPQSV